MHKRIFLFLPFFKILEVEKYGGSFRNVGVSTFTQQLIKIIQLGLKTPASSFSGKKNCGATKVNKMSKTLANRFLFAGS